MNRLEEIFQQGRLLFTPKVYPKYFNNKLRVFKPSVILQIGLASAAVFGLSRLWQMVSPNQVIIPYPQQSGQSKA